MAVATVSVTGSVQDPSGTGLDGFLRIELLGVQAGEQPTADGERVSAYYVVELGASGAVSFEIVPNDQITPSGTYYGVRYEVGGVDVRRRESYERWQVASSPDPVEIGDIPRV